MKNKIFLFIIILLLILDVNVSAKGLFVGENKVVVNEKKDGTSFIGGDKVKVESDTDIRGIAFIGGNEVNVSGQSDYLILGGNKVVVDLHNTNDAFIGGNDIKISNLFVNRDMYVGGDEINISAFVGRNTYIGADKVVLSGEYRKDVIIGSEDIEIKSDTIIDGVLKYPKNAKINISDDAVIEKTKTYINNNDVTFKIKSPAIIGSIVSNIFSFLNKLVIGIIFIFIFGKSYNEFIKKLDLNKAITDSFLGFGLLIIGFICSILLLFTLVGVSLGIISLIICFLSIYLASIYSSYYISSYLLKDKIKNKYLITLIGLIGCYIIGIIPIIGGICSFIIFIFGLGLLFRYSLFLIKKLK